MDVVYVSGGGQYKHKGDVLRATPYAAFNGQEGVIGPPDMKVVEGSTPGGFVNVNAGVAAILGRGPAQSYEMYVAKSETQESVAVPATDSSGPRSDLIIVRVVDPDDGPAGDTTPADPVNGPYAFVERIPDVDASTTKLSDTFAVHGVRSGYALARVDLPSSTGTVTNSEIVPLRSLANARREFFQRSNPHSDTTLGFTSTTAADFPQENGTFTVDIPPWATRMDARLDVILAGARTEQATGNIWGNHNLVLDGSVIGFGEWDLDWNGGASMFLMSVATNTDVTSHQGDTVTIQSQAVIQGGNGELWEQNGTKVTLQCYFTEEAL